MPVALAAATGCRTPPQDVPQALESALLRQDRAAVLALVDRASQPLVEAALNSSADRQKSPYWLRVKPAPTRVLGTEQGDAGLVVTVESGGAKREWVLVEEGGGWKVDLAATAAHRAWDVSFRESK